MPMEFDTSEDISDAFLKEPGTYHLVCYDSQEAATDKEGKPLDAFRISASVAAGTVPGQVNKTVDLLFFHPKPTDKNGGEFALKRRTRALIALSKVRPAEIGKRVSIDLTPETTIGRQFIATLEKAKDKDYLQLHFADIFHVDDPEAAAFPKAAKLLAMLPAEWRLTAKDFGVEQSTSGAAPSANGNGAATKPSAASKSAVNLDDI